MGFIVKKQALFLLFFSSFYSYIFLSSALSKNNKVPDSCSPHILKAAKKYGIPKRFLWGLAYVESNYKGVPWAWALNVSGRSHYFSSQKEAIRFLRGLSQNKLTYTDIGCMQINYKFHRNAFKSVTEMLEPQKNVFYGAQFLRKLYKKSKVWEKAIGDYHSKRRSTKKEKKKRGDYVKKVLLSSKKMK